MSLDLDELMSRLKFVDDKQTGFVDVLAAIVEPPVVIMTIEGASTLEVTVSDAARELIRSDAVQTRSWATVAGVNFELVALSKSADRYTLTYEDAIVAALRRRTKPLSIRANTSTRREITLRLAKEANVKAVVDPTHRGKVHNAVKRSTRKEKSNSWECLGTDIAEPIQWRRFSNGRQLVVGGDRWLLDRDPAPTPLREHTGGVQDIDFDLDVGKPASEATAVVDADLWSIPPGDACLIEDLGPANGRWLVSEFTRPLTSARGTVSLIRPRHTLKEPKRERTTRNRGKGDPGEPDFTPDRDGATPTTPTTPPNSARERMVQFALAQDGKPYVWGAKGPNSYDCSGLVQAATAAAGKTLGAPSASQAATVQGAGGGISVDAAIRTRGALLFRIGVGDYNHIAISLGNGSTIEAMGSAYGCGVFSAADRGWTGGGIWL